MGVDAPWREGQAVIDPGGIPTIPGDMDALAGHAAVLRGVGGEFASTGQRVNSTWQDLGAVYQAPEVGQLLTATAPVAAVSAAVGADLATVARALSAYAGEVRRIQVELVSLRSQAGTFVASLAGVADWTVDGARVERNAALIGAVNAQLAAFFEAQRRCANTINALYGGPQYRADDGDGQLREGEYGYTAQALDAAAGRDGALPWGETQDRDRGLLGDIGAFFCGAGEAAVGVLTGLGALIGLDASNGQWSWATAGSAWAGLGTLVLAAGVYVTPGGMLLDQHIGVPGLKRGQLGDTLLGAGKAMIAYDEWGTDPARAAGMTTVNVVAAVLGTKGMGAGLRITGAAAETSRFTLVSTAGTTMVRAGEAIGRLPTVKDLITGITHRIPGLHPPDLIDTTPASHHSPTPTTRTDLSTSYPRLEIIPRTGSVGGALTHSDPAPDHPGEHADTPAAQQHIPTDDAQHVSGDDQHTTDAPDPPDPDASSHDLDAPVGEGRWGTQPDGSWIGVEHGITFTLEPAANRAADQLLASAASAEPHISPRVTSIAEGIEGARMQGYPEFVLKSEKSLKRKIATDLIDHPERRFTDVINKFNDSVRYTIEIPPSHYTDGVGQAVREMQARGFENVSWKPSWKDPRRYKGLNSTWRDPGTGHVFELQFHTPDSFIAKMVTHPLFEAKRLPGVSQAEIQRLDDQQALIFGSVEVPQGVERLSTLEQTLEIR